MPRRFFVHVLLLIAAIAAYGRVVECGFVDYDDPEYVRDNPMVQRGLTSDGVCWACTTNHVVNWHPLTWLSLMLDSNLWRGWVVGYHVTNVVLHIANVILLFELLLMVTKGRALWRSALVAGLLALHPIHVESVAWISERKDVLSTLFWLLAMIAYVKYARLGGVGRYVWVAALMALGLMTKPMLVTLPFVLLLVDFWPLRRIRGIAGERLAADPARMEVEPVHGWGRLILEKVPLMALAAISAIITMRVQSGLGKLEEGVWIPLTVRIENAIVSYVRYLGKLFCPVDLAVLYPNPSQISQPFWSTWQVIGAAAILIVIAVVAARLIVHRPYFIVGWLWFLGTLVPVIGLVQIGRQAMADRYAYVPFIGLYVIVAWGLGDIAARWPRLRPAISAAASVALAACAVLTFNQIRYWRDSVALFEHAVESTERNWLMHNNLAAMLEKQGEIELALVHVRESIAVYSGAAWVHNHLGTLLVARGSRYDAQQAFEKAIALDPEQWEAHLNLGSLLGQGQQMHRAAEHLRQAVEINPRSAEAHKALAIVLSELGLDREAIEHLEQAKALQPDLAHEYDRIIAIIRKTSAAPQSRD